MTEMNATLAKAKLQRSYWEMTSLDQRYGQIRISAVAAAARARQRQSPAYRSVAQKWDDYDDEAA